MVVVRLLTRLERVFQSRGGAKKAEDAKESESPAPELSSIDIGDSLPSFTLKNEKGEDVDVSTLTEEKGVVFFLVPKADTRGCCIFRVIENVFLTLAGFLNELAGCTNQACGFRDIYPDFTGSGYEVYCLSADSPAAQTKWQTKVHFQLCVLRSAALN